MQPLAAGRLGKALEADPGERVAHVDSRFGHALPGQPLIGVEIHRHPVGHFELVDPRAPGMDFQHAHLHQPDEAGQILDVGIDLRLLFGRRS